MNKYFPFLIILFLLCTGTAMASHWYVSPTNTRVQSLVPSYSFSYEVLWDKEGAGSLPVTYIECINGSCTTTQANLWDSQTSIWIPGSTYAYGNTCDGLAAHFGIAANTYTCSQNHNEYGWATGGTGSGGGDGGLGVSVPDFGWYRQLQLIELHSGIKAGAAPCKPEPSGWASIPLARPADASYHDTECTVTTHAGNDPPVATIDAIPGTISAGNSSALTYTCSNSATVASINNGVGVVTPASSGTVSVSPNTKTTYILTCTNAVGSSQAQETVTVNPVLTVDLIADSVTPTTATAGVATTLNAIITNTGNANSDHFPVLFQVQQTGALFNSAYITSIGPGDTFSSSASYTFPSAGTYLVRACANNNTSWVNIATESNYANNCGPWTSVIVTPAVTPTTACTVSPSSLPDTGGTVTYNANPSTGVGAPYTWTPSDGIGSYGTGVTATRTFTSADKGNSYGMSVTGTPVSTSNCPGVAVGSQCGGSPTGTITANPARIRSGTATSIKTSAVQNVKTSCVVSGPGINYTINAVACVTPVETLPTPSLTTQAVYTLTCDGVKTSTVIVNVLPNFTEF